jgi:hypothetical protein
LRIPDSRRIRRGIAGIIGAVILFTLLFTIGTQYFIFVNNANNLETQSLFNRGNTLATRLQEGLQLQTSLSANSYVQFYVNNTGGITVNMTSLVMISSSGSVIECDGAGLPSGQGCGNTTPQLPAVVNVGKGFPAPSGGYIRTSCKYGTNPCTGTVTLKLITSNGNIFSSTYPPSASALASISLTSGAIGDIYLKPQTFSYYNVCTTPSGGCTACASNPCFLQVQGAGFSISHNTFCSTPEAFGLTVVDYNPSHNNITLDAYTELTNLFAPQGSGSNTKNNGWFILSNTTNTVISSSYSPVTLIYGVPKPIVFGSSGSGSFTPFTANCNSIAFPADALIFILTHGCKAVPKGGSCNPNAATYSQNSPYITTLYY